MKRLLTILLLIFPVIFSFVFKNESIAFEGALKPALNGAVTVYYDSDGNRYIYVKGYKRKDGTYVKGYYRSVPDRDKTNNWSSKGNVNPVTGKKGYKKL